MRVVAMIFALLFGLLGSAGSGILGVKWLSDVAKKREEIEFVRQLGEAMQDAKIASELKRLDRMINTAYALIGAAGLGLVAVTFVGIRKGPIAGALFLVAFVVPIVILQEGIVAIFTFGLAFAALASLFVRKPAPAKKSKWDDEEDDEDEDAAR